MKTLIIYAHPYEESFNSKICNYVSSIKKDSEVIDLYTDHFNPLYSKEELEQFQFGKTLDPLVEQYQEKIKSCKEIIFIFPIWWNDLPAIVKGFIDLVMKKNFSYEDSPRGIIGKLKFIDSVLVITTSNSPTWYIRLFAGNSIRSVFLNATCRQLGIKNRKWLNLGSIKNSTESKRKDFFGKIKNILRD